jgi:hypothetical protein
MFCLPTRSSAVAVLWCELSVGAVTVASCSALVASVGFARGNKFGVLPFLFLLTSFPSTNAFHFAVI